MTDTKATGVWLIVERNSGKVVSCAHYKSEQDARALIGLKRMGIVEPREYLPASELEALQAENAELRAAYEAKSKTLESITTTLKGPMTLNSLDNLRRWL